MHRDSDPAATTSSQERELIWLYRHRLYFGVGLLLGLCGALAARLGAGAAPILFALAGLAWIGSGVSAIKARRHMFGGFGSGMAVVRTRSSGPSRVGSIFVGIFVALLGLGLGNVALQLWLAAAK